MKRHTATALKLESDVAVDERFDASAALTVPFTTKVASALASPLPHTARMSSRTTHTESASFGGHATRARVRAGDGPTVLCLHGYSDSADAWRPFEIAFQHPTAHLVALDLPGYGEGPKRVRRPASLLDQVCDFTTAAVAHYAKDGPVVLLGHSLGGRAALAAAARRPDDVAAVIALAPAPLRLRLWARALAAERRLIPLATRLMRHLPEQLVVGPFMRAYRRTYFDSRAIDPNVFARYAAYCDGRRVARYLHDLHRIASELSAPLDLSTVRMPVDILWGRNDALVPVIAAREYLHRLPQARYLEIADCGHEIPLEKPASVARVLRQRLAALAGPAAFATAA